MHALWPDASIIGDTAMPNAATINAATPNAATPNVLLSYNALGVVLYALLLLGVLVVALWPAVARQRRSSCRYLTVIALLAAVRTADYCVLLFLRPEGSSESHFTAWSNVLTMTLFYGALLDGITGPLSLVVATHWAPSVRTALQIIAGVWCLASLAWGVSASLCAAGAAACPFVSAAHHTHSQREVRSGFFHVQHFMLAAISGLCLTLLVGLLAAALRQRAKRRSAAVVIVHERYLGAAATTADDRGGGATGGRTSSRLRQTTTATDVSLYLALLLAILSCGLRAVVDLEANVAGGWHNVAGRSRRRRWRSVRRSSREEDARRRLRCGPANARLCARARP